MLLVEVCARLSKLIQRRDSLLDDSREPIRFLRLQARCAEGIANLLRRESLRERSAWQHHCEQR